MCRGVKTSQHETVRGLNECYIQCTLDQRALHLILPLHELQPMPKHSP